MCNSIYRLHISDFPKGKKIAKQIQQLTPSVAFVAYAAVVQYYSWAKNVMKMHCWFISQTKNQAWDVFEA